MDFCQHIAYNRIIMTDSTRKGGDNGERNGKGNRKTK